MVYKDYVVLYGRTGASKHFKHYTQALREARKQKKKNKNITITIDMITHYDRDSRGRRIRIMEPGETDWSQRTIKVIQVAEEDKKLFGRKH